MNNFMDTLHLLEQRASGIVAWLTSQSSQVRQMEERIAKGLSEIQEMYTHIAAIRSEIAKRKPDAL